MHWHSIAIALATYLVVRISGALVYRAWSRRSPRPARPRRARRIARAVIAWRMATTRWQRFTADVRMFPRALNERWVWHHLVMPTYRSRNRLAPPLRPVPDWWKQ